MSKLPALKKSKEILTVFEKGNRLYGKYVNLYYVRADYFAQLIVVKKKFYKKAVIRNFVRRRVREIVRVFFKRYGDFPLLNLIIYVKPNKYNISFKKLHNDVVMQMKKMLSINDSRQYLI